LSGRRASADVNRRGDTTAVCNLGVGHIIVMGHTNCGGIAALMATDKSAAGEAGVLLSFHSKERRFLQLTSSQ